MKVKTSELTGQALAWAVGTAEGDRVYRMRVARPIDWNDTDDSRWVVKAQVPNVGWFADYIYQPYINWSQGGPIIERLMNESHRFFLENDKGHGHHCALSITPHDNYHGCGPTPLIAAMRCYVASNLGEEVEVPDELFA